MMGSDPSIITISLQCRTPPTPISCGVAIVSLKEPLHFSGKGL
jgi:hypothetical protein